MNTIIVKITPELVEAYLTQGNRSRAHVIEEGLPPGARLSHVEYDLGIEPRCIKLHFETDYQVIESKHCRNIRPGVFEKDIMVTTLQT